MNDSVKEFIKKEGIFYHTQLAPGVVFDEKNADRVEGVIKRNMERMASAVGGPYDLKLQDIF